MGSITQAVIGPERRNLIQKLFLNHELPYIQSAEPDWFLEVLEALPKAHMAGR